VELQFDYGPAEVRKVEVEIQDLERDPLAKVHVREIVLQ
jgi:hypothetical protein